MPVVRTYKGTPVVHVKRVRKGIRLTLANSRPGEVHPRMIITQEEWKRDVKTRYVEPPKKEAAIPDLHE